MKVHSLDGILMGLLPEIVFCYKRPVPIHSSQGAALETQASSLRFSWPCGPGSSLVSDRTRAWVCSLVLADLS